MQKLYRIRNTSYKGSTTGDRWEVEDLLGTQRVGNNPGTVPSDGFKALFEHARERRATIRETIEIHEYDQTAYLVIVDEPDILPKPVV